MILAWAVPPVAGGSVHCTTTENTVLQRLETVCDDGTRAISYWNRTLERWETLITASPRPACTGQLNPLTRQVEVRCR